MSRWSDDDLDKLARKLDSRPTYSWVNRRIREETRGSSFSSGQVAVAVISGLFVVVAALIAAYVQLKTATPIPVK